MMNVTIVTIIIPLFCLGVQYIRFMAAHPGLSFFFVTYLFTSFFFSFLCFHLILSRISFFVTFLSGLLRSFWKGLPELLHLDLPLE